jgi:sulfur carrier protein
MILNGTISSFRGTIEQLLIHESITPRGVAVAINGEIISKSAWNTTTLQESDVIEIVTAAAGG